MITGCKNDLVVLDEETLVTLGIFTSLPLMWQ